MFTNSKSFSSFSVDDLAAAKNFYGETLALHHTGTMGLLEVTLADGHQIMIYPKDDHQPATFTVLNFQVDDIDAAVDELTAKGVKFETYDMDDFKTGDKGIMDSGEMGKMAWFKDPAGNILSVTSAA